MTADGTPITTGGVYDYACGTFTPSTMTLNYGEKSITKAGLPTSQASTISYVLPTQMLGVGSHQLVASYPGDQVSVPVREAIPTMSRKRKE